MKNTSLGLNIDAKLFSVLLLPSWLSGMVDLVFSLTITVGAIVLSRYQGSSIRVDYQNYIANNQNIYNSVHSGFFANPFVSNLPLILFWILIGIVVYMFAVNVVTAIKHTAELTTELEYTNVNRRSLLIQAFLHLLIRAVVLVIWLLYIIFFFRHILPYCVAATLAGLGQLPSISGIVYIIMAFLVLLITTHLHAIMLRLLLLRPRVFSQAVYVDVD